MRQLAIDVLLPCPFPPSITASAPREMGKQDPDSGSCPQAAESTAQLSNSLTGEQGSLNDQRKPQPQPQRMGAVPTLRASGVQELLASRDLSLEGLSLSGWEGPM